MTEIYERLIQAAGQDCVSRMEPMELHTTFRVGGPAQFFVTPKTLEAVRQVMELCKNSGLPFWVMGNGSNLLVSDEGLKGVVLCLEKNFSGVTRKENRLTARAGTRLTALARRAAGEGLSGLEFAGGIPGCLGGAVTMNAGAYGGEMSQIVTGVTLLFPEGDIRRLAGEEMEFGYRTSIVERTKAIVLEAELTLKPDRPEEIKNRMDELNQRRREKQPLEFPSAGSTFKRPEGYFAGKLIEEAGLAGFSIGGAAVSEKHCGFVINRENATARDIYDLCRHIQRLIRERYGVNLETEVRIWGNF